MSGHPRLYQRGARYYLRVRVPADVAKFFDGREVKESLQTTDYREALRRVRIKSVEVDNRFEEARRRRDATVVHFVPPNDLHWIARRVFQEEIAAHDADLKATPDGDPEQWEMALEAVRDDWELGLCENHWSKAVDDRVADILERRGFRVSPGTVGFAEARTFIARAVMAANLTAIQWARGNYAYVHGDPLFQEGGKSILVAHSLIPRGPELTFRELVSRYLADPKKRRNSPKTRIKSEATFRLLGELLGNEKPVRSITREDCKAVRDVIFNLAPNYTKRFPKLSAHEVARMVEQQGLKRVAPKTANGYLAELSALLKWAETEEYLDKNPARGLALFGTDVAPEEKKDPFSAEQLRAIFGSPLYTGCLDDAKGYARPGSNRPRRGRFWVPLLSLWTGMRLNECCQLNVTDIQDVDDTLSILISDDPTGGDEADRKRIKTKAGRRFVPIHPELKKIGFPSYVEERRRAGDKRLFPDLPLGAQGYYSDPFSQWFGRFLKSLGVKTAKTSFHSFRHNYRDALREADISRDRVRALGGWRNDDGTEEIYGRGLKASTLYEEIQKVRYDGLDLSHLYPENVI